MLVGHKKQWEFFRKKAGSGQLSHAYLFSGEEGIGKKLFAKEFVEFIGCKFPDLMIIDFEKKEIPISKIREVQSFLSYKSYHGGFRAVIVDSAEKMNQEAQSCFLKTLEEPKGKTLLFLITSKPDIILPTIISRCQVIKFSRPRDLPEDKEKTERHRKIFENLATALNSDFSGKFRYTKSLDFNEQDPLEILEVMQKYLRCQLLEKSGVNLKNSRGCFLEVRTPIKNYPFFEIKKAIDLTEEINNKLLFTNANPKLALEVLLLEL